MQGAGGFEIGGGEMGGGFGGVEGFAPEAAIPETPMAEAPSADAGGGMGGFDDPFKGFGGFGGFFADGGRVHKDGGGPAGGLGGMGGPGVEMAGGRALADAGMPSTMSDLTDPFGGRDILAPSIKPSFGLGEKVLGQNGPSPSAQAGFGKLQAGQEQRTGNNLVKGWMDEYRQDYKGGPQRTPKEQGMPDMPGQDWYNQNLNISDMSVGSPGTSSPGGISYTPIMTGMGGGGGGGGMGGFGLFPTFNPPTNGSDYNDTTKMFQPSPSNGKVAGYYTGLDSQQINPDTGLFNTKYIGPYYGGFYAKGGRVNRDMGGRIGLSGGGNPGLTPEALYQYLLSLGADQRQAAMLVGNARAESSLNPYQMHDKNTGYGLWGHGKDRWQDMQKYTGQTKPGWQDQARFALWELNNSPKAAMARQALRVAKSPEEIAIAGMHYERPQGYKPNAPQQGHNFSGRLNFIRNSMGLGDVQAMRGMSATLPTLAAPDSYGYIAPSNTVSSGSSPSSTATSRPLPLSSESGESNFLMDILNGIFGDKGLIGQLFADDEQQPAATRTTTAQPATPAPTTETAPAVTPATPAPKETPKAADTPAPKVEQATPTIGFGGMGGNAPGSRGDALDKVMRGDIPDANKVDVEQPIGINGNAPPIAPIYHPHEKKEESRPVSLGFDENAFMGGGPDVSQASPDLPTFATLNDLELKKRGGSIRKKYATDGEVKDDKKKEEPKVTGEVTYGPKFELPPPIETGKHGFGALAGEGGDFYQRWATNPMSQFLWNLGQHMMAHDGDIGQSALSALPHAMQSAMGAAKEQAVLDKARAQQQADIDFVSGLRQLEVQRARGGQVRKGYLAGGAPEEGFGDLGDFFGGNEEVAPAPRAVEQAPEGGGFFDFLGGAEEAPAPAPRQQSVAEQPSQGGGLFDIFGGGEEAPARAAAQPQETQGGLFDFLGGGSEEEAAPQARPEPRAVATDRQSRGLLDDLFGGFDEQPTATTAQPAKKEQPAVVPAKEKETVSTGATPETKEPTPDKVVEKTAEKTAEKTEEKPATTAATANTYEETAQYKDIQRRRAEAIAMAPRITSSNQQKALDNYLRDLNHEAEQGYRRWHDLRVEERTQGKGEVGVVTENGVQRRYWRSGPKAGQWVEDATSPNAPAADTKYGKEYLDTLPKERQSMLEQIYSGQADIKSFPAKNRIALFQEVEKAYPDFNPESYVKRHETWLNYTKAGQNNARQKTLSANKLIEHGALLTGLANDIGNKWNAYYANLPMNELAKVTSPEYANKVAQYNVVRQMYVDELGAFMHGAGGGTQAEREKAYSHLDPNQSKGALAGALEGNMRMMMGQLTPLQTEWFSTMGENTKLPNGTMSVIDKPVQKSLMDQIKVLGKMKGEPINVDSSLEDLNLKEPSKKKETTEREQNAPAYSGPVIINPQTGQRMRLSDDRKSWVAE
jgi:hypothetical protein